MEISDNFVKEVTAHFRYLTDELGYPEPVLSRDAYSDMFTYENLPVSRTVKIHNAYHPVDYGFEFNVYNLELGKETSGDHLKNHKMLRFVLKEDQDPGQSYIRGVAEEIYRNYAGVLKGECW